jgi:small subunit ribosomal protein S8
MSMTDPIADFLTRIRNGLHAGHDEVVIPHSKMKAELARILQEQGYIVGWSVERARVGEELHVQLKYTENRSSVISGLKRVSKPGRRIYASKDRLPRVLGGLGTAILSTSRGVITSRTAEREGIGGEVICFVW